MKASYLISLLCCMAMSAAPSEARRYFHPYGLAFPRWNNGMPWWTGYWVDPQLIHPRVPAAPERIECWYRLEKTVGCVYSIFQFFYGKTHALSPECCYRVRTIGDECAESVFTRFADGFDKKIESHCALPGPDAAAPH